MRYVSKEEAGKDRTTKKEIIEREAQKIYDRHGTLTPNLMVEAATPVDHPLHDQFEWDNDIAGARYRIAQARQMILATKFVCILKETKHKPPQVLEAEEVRKFLPSLEGGFKMRNEVFSDKDSRKLFVERKVVALKSWCKSVVDVVELDAMRSTIEQELLQYQ